MRVLLVKDSRSIRLENERALIRVGYEVICAEDGEEALQRAKEEQPDLILLDMMLPRLGGLEVLRRLKRDKSTASIPVVVLSGLSEKNRDKLMEAGAEDYLEKNTLMPGKGVNLLPKVLEEIVCRINRRRGVQFSQTTAVR